ncbi:MAG: hypothetical protein EPN97_13275 [Alphaproteobacteria bacterium]|nr:MAG: hypothetical protein EPN97_13275 [Alphaproteobacteria bacterium]
MKFNPVVIRAAMHTQFLELRRAKGTDAQTAEEHYPFRAEDVEDMYFNRGSMGKGVWFRLKDGRIFDVRGEIAAPATPEAAASKRAVAEDLSDLDAMDTLPLSLMPLSCSALKAAKLIKNGRLETVVELHRDSKAGSLQMRPEDVPAAFPGHRQDHKTIAALATLHSYDVYSLRRTLLKAGVEADEEQLRLSDDMKQQLAQFSPEFTRPLLRTVYGDDDPSAEQDLTRLFRAPNKTKVAERLKTMSQKTGIPVEDIPEFLETYSDLFLSVIYYRQNLDRITPDIDNCASWLKDITLQRDAAASAQNALHYRRVDESIRFLSSTIRVRLNSFRHAFDIFWRDINRDALNRLRRDIEGNHAATGGMLCGLVVKMRHWSRTFQSRTSGGPGTRTQYVISEMEPGLERLCHLR